MIEVNFVEELGFEGSTLKKFKEISSTDESSRVVMEYVLKGWPSEKDQGNELTRIVPRPPPEGRSVKRNSWRGFRDQTQSQVLFYMQCLQQRESLYPHDIPGLPW